MESLQPTIDVFISRKTADAALANKLYQHFRAQGLNVFESHETLPAQGNSDFRKAIDNALDECKHMVVVGSSVENISSPWVEAEWSSYINEKRAGRKTGNILTVITGDIEKKDLPISLRNNEVIFYDKKNFERIAAYVGKDYEDPQYKYPRKNLLKLKWFLPAVSGVFLLALFGYYINERNKPFDATIFLKPYSEIKLHPSYPAFEGGELSLLLDNKEEKKTLLPDGEAVFKQLPVSFRGKKITAKLTAKNWKLMLDTIELDKTVNMAIVPDESLSTVYGNVKDQLGNGIADCRIIIDNNDTAVFTSGAGFFKVSLPYRMQKPQYVLNIMKEGYKPGKEFYYAKSGNIDIELRSNNQ